MIGERGREGYQVPPTLGVFVRSIKYKIQVVQILSLITRADFLKEGSVINPRCPPYSLLTSSYSHGWLVSSKESMTAPFSVDTISIFIPECEASNLRYPVW